MNRTHWRPGIAACTTVSILALVGILSGSTASAHALGDSKPALGGLKPVVPLATILAEYADGPHIKVRAKLVTLASVAAIDPGLAYCYSEACEPGELVWLVLQDGPPRTFLHPTPSDYAFPRGFATWQLHLVDAATGVPRNISEVGNAGQLSSSPWGRLKNLVFS